CLVLHSADWSAVRRSPVCKCVHPENAGGHLQHHDLLASLRHASCADPASGDGLVVPVCRVDHDRDGDIAVARAGLLSMSAGAARPAATSRTSHDSATTPDVVSANKPKAMSQTMTKDL